MLIIGLNILIFFTIILLASPFFVRNIKKEELDQRLASAISTQQIQYKDKIKEKLDKAKRARQLPVLRAITKTLETRLNKLFPSAIIKNYSNKLEHAGIINIRAHDFIVIKLFVGVIGFFLPVAFELIKNHRFVITSIFMSIFAFIGAYFLPDFWLSKQIRARRKSIKKMLAFTLDLLKVCIEAGLDLNGAFAKVVEKTKGPLSEEFEKMLYEIRLGKQRSQALADLSKRINLPELNSFITIIIQGDKLGMSIGQIIDSQSEQIRIKMSQQIREKAATMPAKMMIPMVIFILPAMFLVILGPAVLKALGLGI